MDLAATQRTVPVVRTHALEALATVQALSLRRLRERWQTEHPATVIDRQTVDTQSALLTHGLYPAMSSSRRMRRATMFASITYMSKGSPIGA